MEILLVILGPVIALTGTIIGISIGERRASRRDAENRQARFRTEQQTAYTELWNIVEDTHLTIREPSNGVSAQLFAGQITDVNNYMIRKGIYISSGDRHLVLEYLFWTYEFTRRIAADEELKDQLVISVVHYDLPSRVASLEQIRNNAYELRHQLKKRIQEVLGVPPTTRNREDSRPSTDLIRKLRDLTDELAESSQSEQSPSGTAFLTTDRLGQLMPSEQSTAVSFPDDWHDYLRETPPPLMPWLLLPPEPPKS